MKKRLLDDFEPTSKEDWIAQAIKDLKGKNFEETLVSQSLEGFAIQPFYTREDTAEYLGLKEFHHKINPKPEVPGSQARVWSNTVRISVNSEKESNVVILDSLQNGADGIVLDLKGLVDFSILLKGVQPSYIQIFLEPKENPIQVFGDFKSWLMSEGHGFSAVFGGVIWDGSVQFLTRSTERKEVRRVCKELVGMGKELPHFRSLTIQSSHYHNSGANVVQELAFSLGFLIDLIDDLNSEKIDTSELFGNLIFQTAVGADYFMEIAKVKLIRIMLQKLASLYQLAINPEEIFIYVQTGFWSKSGVDLQTNMLRNTTEAMSAILGGCNALEVLRHDVVGHEPSGFSLRMSRNISNILKEESYFDRVLDPVAGSYFLEKLIGEIFEKVQNRLVEIEDLGGWWDAVGKNLLQAEIKETRKYRQQMVMEGKKVKVGVNRYLSGKENAVLSSEAENNESIEQLKISRESCLSEFVDPSMP
ncbi:methylmalonyl-CoA mutase family protein [Belliella marina]|uniref:Methylmalonyl-CoA mutase family protein n=1 Tax=Belliella marina TaxID=1644146 RepID=A0ABW4VFE3_9BACT